MNIIKPWFALIWQAGWVPWGWAEPRLFNWDHRRIWARIRATVASGGLINKFPSLWAIPLFVIWFNSATVDWISPHSPDRTACMSWGQRSCRIPHPRGTWIPLCRWSLSCPFELWNWINCHSILNYSMVSILKSINPSSWHTHSQRLALIKFQCTCEQWFTTVHHPHLQTPWPALHN